MNGRRAALFKHFIMQIRAVALMLVKAILRKFFVKPDHFFIATCFGDNRRRGNERNFLVPLYDCFLIVMLRRGY